MPTEIFDEEGNTIEAFDEDGNPVEVFGKEEVEEKVSEVKTQLEEKLEEATEKHDEDLAKKDEEIEKIKADIEAGEGGDKGKNLSKLRQAKEKAEAEKAEIKKEFEDFKEETKKEISGIKETVSNKRIDDAIDKKVSGDKELGEKVRLYFNKLKPTEETDPTKIEEDFQERIKQAYLLATGGSDPNTLGNLAATKGGYVAPGQPAKATKGAPDAETTEMGKKHMGVTDKDVREYKKSLEQ